MPTVRDILSVLDRIAPKRYALSFDKVGLQVGYIDQTVTTAVVALDRSLGAVDFACECEAELLVAHHPLLFTPLTSVDTRTYEGRAVVKLIRQGTSFIAAHTNWDAAKGGVNDILAEIFGLQNISSFGMAAEVSQLKLVVTAPPDAADKIIDAASAAGAGVIGAYSRCAFTSIGRGTFVGGDSSNPTIGAPGSQEAVEECRMEMVLRESDAKAVVRAVRRVHPYEEPAIDLFTLRPVDEQPLGRIGTLPRAMSLAEVATLADRLLDVRSWTWGDPAKKIKKLALLGGAADSSWMDAQRAGADALLTGEVKQHVGLEASESGMPLIAAGHYQTEHPGAAALCTRLEAAVPEVQWRLYTPEPGQHGRPF